jgi:type I restriction enzyme, S subunit
MGYRASLGSRQHSRGEEPPRSSLLSVFLNRGVIAYGEGGGQVHKPGLDLSIYQVVRRGDFVLNNQQAWRGSVGVSKQEGIISPAYVVLALGGLLNPRFADYLLQSRDMVAQYVTSSKGVGDIQRDIHIPWLKNVKVPLPPREEQAAVVRFLDWATVRLERAIRAKRKVIALLNEQKRAIIHRAVTRGLDLSVPLKPSGIPWLGDIPQHWEVRRLRHLIVGRLTYGANAAAEFTNPDWPRYIRITDFRADGSLKGDTFRSLHPSVARDYMVDPGDILLARSGATVGKAFLVVHLTGAACHAGYLIRARPDRSLVFPEFLFAFSQSSAFAVWKDTTFNTATIQNIGADKYANLSVPLPPLTEQQTILASVGVKQAPLLAAISRLDREIELLREYRTRLVAEVVTGKLDVRETAARLPDQAPPDSSEDYTDLSDETEALDEEAVA